MRKSLLLACLVLLAASALVLASYSVVQGWSSEMNGRRSLHEIKRGGHYILFYGDDDELRNGLCLYQNKDFNLSNDHIIDIEELMSSRCDESIVLVGAPSDEVVTQCWNNLVAQDNTDLQTIGKCLRGETVTDPGAGDIMKGCEMMYSQSSLQEWCAFGFRYGLGYCIVQQDWNKPVAGETVSRREACEYGAGLPGAAQSTPCDFGFDCPEDDNTSKAESCDFWNMLLFDWIGCMLGDALSKAVDGLMGYISGSLRWNYLIDAAPAGLGGNPCINDPDSVACGEYVCDPHTYDAEKCAKFRVDHPVHEPSVIKEKKE